MLVNRVKIMEVIHAAIDSRNQMVDLSFVMDGFTAQKADVFLMLEEKRFPFLGAGAKCNQRRMFGAVFSRRRPTRLSFSLVESFSLDLGVSLEFVGLLIFKQVVKQIRGIIVHDRQLLFDDPFPAVDSSAGSFVYGLIVP